MIVSIFYLLEIYFIMLKIIYFLKKVKFILIFKIGIKKNTKFEKGEACGGSKLNETAKAMLKEKMPFDLISKINWPFHRQD